MLSEDTRNAIRLFYRRREARLRQRLAAAEDLMERYRLLKAIYANRRSASKMFGERNFYGQPLDIGGKSYTIKFQNISADGGPGSGNHGHKGRPGKQGGSSASASAEGRNKPCTGFRDQGAEKRHQKHWQEFGVSSHSDYAKKAIDFIKQPVGGNIDGYARDRDGAVVRFDVTTGEIGIGIPGGEIITYFKAKCRGGKVDIAAANNYFNERKKRERYEQADGIEPLLSCLQEV